MEYKIMKQYDWKQLLPYLVAIVVFIGIALLYCSPVLEGKVLHARDRINWQGASSEALQFKEQTGETTWWTNSMFGGMPTYQITGRMSSTNLMIRMHDIANGFWTDNFRPIGMLFAYFFGFFLMLLCFGVNPWLSIVGGLAIGLSSYFLLIIPAGHMTKADAIAFLAPMIGGFYAIFRKKYWLGAPLFTIYGIICTTLHPQMTYYMCMLMGIMGIAEVWIHVSEKRWKDLGIGIGLLVVCGLLIFGTKLSWWQMNQSYLKETMRGGHSELTQSNVDKSKQAGLDIDYVTASSYGKAETLTLLVPEYMGMASGYDLGKDSPLEKDLKNAGVPARQAKGFCQKAPTYWGGKAFTSGPVYVGAVICMLFVLGLLIVPGTYKWALLIATLFSILLAWGRNFMPLTQFFYDYFPMYNKFRAVESILVVAEVTIPLLGFLGLKQLMEDKNKNDSKQIWIAGGVTALVCLCVALFGANNPVSSYDAQWKGQFGNDIYRMILNQRTAMAHASAWRSLLFVILGTIVVWWYSRKVETKNSILYLTIALGALILVDMVPVDRKLFSEKNFMSKEDDTRVFAMQPWEEQILQDKSLDYRVFNLNANTFNDARTSYRLKSIGGYSAAKLRRYQDLIDAHISKNNWNVLNMLNTKYIITRDGQVHLNPEAFGNAWFVDSLVCVNNPDAESEALNTLDLRQVAVTDTTFAANKALATATICTGQSSIVMTDYQPNKLTYKAETDTERMVVFSEIYYPYDWHLYIDGEEAPICRVDYTLRAAMVPQGKHEIVMQFVPSALKTDKWCMAIYILAIILSIGSIGYYCYRVAKPLIADKR